MRKSLATTAVIAGTVGASIIAGTGVAAAYDPVDHVRHLFVCETLGDMGSSGLAPECNGWRIGTFNSRDCDSIGLYEVTRPGRIARDYLCDRIGDSNYYVLTLNP
ncbi:hypothetical protein ACFTSD_24250 [Nocardiaceae bacterium NPDC056970]